MSKQRDIIQLRREVHDLRRQVNQALLMVKQQTMELADLRRENAELRNALENAQDQLSRNSTNSDRPPSCDSPFDKAKKDNDQDPPAGTLDEGSHIEPTPKKAGGQKGHPGKGIKLLEPTRRVMIKPVQCPCGGTRFKNLKNSHLHQQIELPPVKLEVTHFQLQKGECLRCHKMVTGQLANQQVFGYGPRFMALVAELSGSLRLSRTQVARFSSSVLNLSIGTGTIQKIIDRTSHALVPHYERIAELVQSQPFNHVDETSWPVKARLNWLWVMVHPNYAFYRLDPHRNKSAFLALIGNFTGTLVTDDYGVYKHWGNRQTCLDHLKRAARGLAESSNRETETEGKAVEILLHRIYGWNKSPPSEFDLEQTIIEVNAWIARNLDGSGKSHTFAKRINYNGLHLYRFLVQLGVTPSNNLAERSLRFLVLWRKPKYWTIF